jgi:hypothetical protein
MIEGYCALGHLPCVPVRKRLFDSPVKPPEPHAGAVVVPLSTSVRTTIVDPVLKMAWSPQQSPKMLNSASCHCEFRSGNQFFPPYIIDTAKADN